MSRREDIENGIWSDPDFAALSPLTKLGYIWTFTNAHCGMSGLYKLRWGQLAFELGVDEEAEREVWAELDRADFASYTAGVVLVRTRVKHLRTTGPNMAKSIVSDVSKIDPAHPLRRRFLELYSEVDWLAEYLRPLQGSGKTLPEPFTSLEQAESETPSEGSTRVPGLGHGPGHGPGNGQVGSGTTAEGLTTCAEDLVASGNPA